MHTKCDKHFFEFCTMQIMPVLVATNARGGAHCTKFSVTHHAMATKWLRSVSATASAPPSKATARRARRFVACLHRLKVIEVLVTGHRTECVLGGQSLVHVLHELFDSEPNNGVSSFRRHGDRGFEAPCRRCIDGLVENGVTNLCSCIFLLGSSASLRTV